VFVSGLGPVPAGGTYLVSTEKADKQMRKKVGKKEECFFDAKNDNKTF
jgi:hypothetical protein